MGRKRNETMRGIRGKTIFMVNLATTVDVLKIYFDDIAIYCHC